MSSICRNSWKITDHTFLSWIFSINEKCTKQTTKSSTNVNQQDYHLEYRLPRKVLQIITEF
jgi:hypothetical protein